MPFASLVGADDLDLEFLTAKYRQERDLRLRMDANSQYVEVTAEFSNYSEGQPFGGFKRSGFDREGGPEGLMSWLETKVIFS
jgi:acyl-CoA reductase-like NAD-dependent aldehyde dehydrogenase